LRAKRNSPSKPVQILATFSERAHKLTVTRAEIPQTLHNFACIWLVPEYLDYKIQTNQRGVNHAKGGNGAQLFEA